MAAQAVVQLLEGGFARVRVLVIGEVTLDRYVLGELASEVPVPVLRNARQFARPGGAANVAMSVAGLGCEAFLCGFWGADGAQAELEALLEAAKVDTTGVVTSALGTASWTRMMAGERELLRLEGAAEEARPAEELVRLEARAVELATKVHGVILGGDPTGDLLTAAIRTARAAGIPVLVQAGAADLSLYSGASVVLSGDEMTDEAACVALEEHEIGMLVLMPKGQAITLLGPRDERHAAVGTRDLSGEGDAIVAVLAAALAAGVEAGSAFDLAVLAAGTVAGKVGTAPVVGREVLVALERETATATATSNMER